MGSARNDSEQGRTNVGVGEVSFKNGSTEGGLRTFTGKQARRTVRLRSQAKLGLEQG